jgi:hypothetical protein
MQRLVIAFRMARHVNDVVLKPDARAERVRGNYGSSSAACQILNADCRRNSPPDFPKIIGIHPNLKVFPLPILIAPKAHKIEAVKSDSRDHVAFRPHLLGTEWRRQGALKPDPMVIGHHFGWRSGAERNHCAQSISPAKTRRNHYHRPTFGHLRNNEPRIERTDEDGPGIRMKIEWHGRKKPQGNRQSQFQERECT